jgi:hypothetical protein
MFDKIRMALKLDGKYHCESCGSVDYPTVEDGVKRCSSCGDTEDDALLREIEKADRIAKVTGNGGFYPPNGVTMAIVKGYIHDTWSAYIQYQMPNSVRIVQDCLQIIATTKVFDTFFSRHELCVQHVASLAEANAIIPTGVNIGGYKSNIMKPVLAEFEKEKHKVLRRSWQKQLDDMEKLKSNSGRKKRLLAYLDELKEYKDNFVGVDTYDLILFEVKNELEAIEDVPVKTNAKDGHNNDQTGGKVFIHNIAAKPNTKKQYDETPEEATFLDALMKSAGNYAPYINLYREANGAIAVQYYNESKGGPLTVGTVKLQGKTKNINIKNPSMGTNYDDVFKIDGELDALLPHVGKFAEKIRNNEKALKKTDNMVRRAIGDDDLYHILNKR